MGDTNQQSKARAEQPPTARFSPYVENAVHKLECVGDSRVD